MSSAVVDNQASTHRHLPGQLGRGLLVISQPRATVGLVVVAGVVVSGPPYARRWAVGQDAAELVRRCQLRAGTICTWLPDD
jgi:hypothetical protein